MRQSDIDNKHEAYKYLLYDVIDTAMRSKHKWVIFIQNSNFIATHQ